METLGALSTPSTNSSKRKNQPRKVEELATASTTASTEKVTPDPKHIRTGVPEPKVLFMSPADDGENAREGLDSNKPPPYMSSLQS